MGRGRGEEGAPLLLSLLASREGSEPDERASCASCATLLATRGGREERVASVHPFPPLSRHSPFESWPGIFFSY